MTLPPAVAEKSVHAFRQHVEKNPAAHSGLLAAADFMASSPTEAVFAGSREHPAFEDMRDALHQDYRPNKVTAWSENEEIINLLPLTEGKSSFDGNPSVYLCQKETCHPPVQTGKALTNLLEPPPEIRLNIFDYEKQIENAQKEEQGKFLGVMDQIFKHSGLKK